MIFTNINKLYILNFIVKYKGENLVLNVPTNLIWFRFGSNSICHDCKFLEPNIFDSIYSESADCQIISIWFYSVLGLIQFLSSSKFWNSTVVQKLDLISSEPTTITAISYIILHSRFAGMIQKTPFHFFFQLHTILHACIHRVRRPNCEYEYPL